MSETIIYLEVLHSYTAEEVKHYLVEYRCGETINCRPPYKEGEKNRDWKVNKIPNSANQDDCEKYIGMKLLPL